MPAASVETIAAGSGPVLPASSSRALSTSGRTGISATLILAAGFPSGSRIRPVTETLAAWSGRERKASSRKMGAQNLFTVDLPDLEGRCSKDIKDPLGLARVSPLLRNVAVVLRNVPALLRNV